jgi:hypothetical protein
MSFIVSYETVDSSTECEHECATYNAAQAFVASLDGLLSWHTISNEHGEIDPDHYCIKHNCTTGEGDICYLCEREGDALIARIDAALALKAGALSVTTSNGLLFHVPVYNFNDAKSIFMLLDFNRVDVCKLCYTAGTMSITHRFK